MAGGARRFNVAACGRQIGKTTMGLVLALQAATERGQAVGWFSPTYKYLDAAWRALRAAAGGVVAEKLEQQHRLAFPSGGVIECWSLDGPDAARGRTYDLVIIDEAALVRELAYAFNAAIRPTLVRKQGSAWFLSTPRGFDDFYALYLLGQDGDESEWASWQMPTARSPYIDPAEIEAARKAIPERIFAQEFLAEFVALEDTAVFRGVRAVARLAPEPPQPGRSYVFGVDWGRTNDYTVISVLDINTSKQVALDRFSGIGFELQTERLHAWADLYWPILILAEANSMGMPLVEKLQRGYRTDLGEARRALPVHGWTATNASKAIVVENLSLGIEQGQVTLLQDTIQTGELLAFESDRTPTGMLKYQAPDGQHDDTVIALALAWYAGSQQSATSRQKYAFSNGHAARS